MILVVLPTAWIAGSRLPVTLVVTAALFHESDSEESRGRKGDVGFAQAGLRA